MVCMDTTHVSLLERLKQPAAPEPWARFVELYTPLLYSWACRVGLQQADAADLVQDVFAILVQKLPEFTYDGHGSFRGWLKTILLNRWRNDRRRHNHTPLQDAEAAYPDHVPELEEADYRQYLAGRVLQLIQAEFQPTTWKAGWELLAHNRPAQEVARELGISVNAVYLAKSRVISRARRELEGLLD